MTQEGVEKYFDSTRHGSRQLRAVTVWCRRVGVNFTMARLERSQP
jgi:hypothetical protein